MIRLCALLALCASFLHVDAAISRSIQSNIGGQCNYNGTLINPNGEFLPVYDPKQQLNDCIQVVCKPQKGNKSEMLAYTCGVSREADGKKSTLWEGKKYPDCCRKPIDSQA